MQSSTPNPALKKTNCRLRIRPPRPPPVAPKSSLPCPASLPLAVLPSRPPTTTTTNTTTTTATTTATITSTSPTPPVPPVTYTWPPVPHKPSALSSIVFPTSRPSKPCNHLPATTSVASSHNHPLPVFPSSPSLPLNTFTSTAAKPEQQQQQHQHQHQPPLSLVLPVRPAVSARRRSECILCLKASPLAALVQCATCPIVQHTHCHNPPLPARPTFPWRCASCIRAARKRNFASRSVGTQTDDRESLYLSDSHRAWVPLKLRNKPHLASLLPDKPRRPRPNQQHHHTQQILHRFSINSMPSSPDDPTADNNNDSNASPDEDNMNIDENFQNNSNNSDRQRVGQQHQNNSQHRTDSGIKVDKENDSIDSEQNVIPLRYAVNDAYALLDVKLFSNVDDRDDEMDAVVVDPFHDAALASTLEQQDRRLIHLRKQKQQQHNSQHQNPQHPNYHNHPPKPLTAHQMRQHIPMSSRAMNDSHRQPPPKTPSHLDSHPDLRIHLICEYCLINGARPFASGIFCSARCARGSAASGRSRGRVRGRGRWTRLKGGRQPNVNNTSGTIHDPMADHRSHAVGGTNGDDARDTLSKRRRDMNEPKEGSSSLQQDNDHENTVYVGPDGVAEHCMVRKSNRQRKRPAALIMDDPNVSGASIDDVIGPDSKSQLANNDDMDIKPATTSVVIPLTSQVLAAKHGATSSSPLISTTNGSTQHATKRARSSKDVSIHGTKQGKRDLNDPNGKQGFHNASNGSMMIMNEPYRKNGSAKDKSKQRSNGNIVVGGPHPGANNNGGRGGLRSNGNTKHPGTSSTHVGDAATTGRPAAASSSGNLGLYQNLNTGLNPNASSGSLMKPGKGYKFCHNCDKLIANRRFVCTGCGTENPSAKKGLPRFTGGKESKDGMDIDTNTDVNGIGKVVKNVNSSGKVVKSKTKTKDEKDGKKKKKKRKSTKDKAKETEKDKDQGNLKKPIKLRIVVPGKKRSDNSYNSSNYSLNNSIGKKKTEAVKDHHHHHINKSSSNRNVDRAPNIYNGGGGGEHDFDDDVGSNDNNVEQANNKKDEVKSTSPPSWRGETWLSARDVRVLRTLGYESARDFVSQPPLAGFGSAKGKDGLKLEERCWALYRRVLDKLQVPKPRGSGLVSNNEDAKNSVHGDEFGEYDNGPGAAAVADRDNVDDNDNMDNDDDDMDDDDDDDNGDLSSDDREEEDIEVEGLEEDENEPDHHAHHHHRDRHSRENDSDSSSDERDDDDDDDGDGDDNGDNRRQHVAHNDDGEDEDVVDINKNGNENDHYDSESDRGSGWYDEDARPAAAAASRYNVEYMDRHATYHPNGKYSGRQEEEDSFHSEHPSQSESPRHHEGRQDDDDVLDSRYGADQQQQRPDDDGSGGDSDDGGDSSEGDMNNDEGRQQQQREKEGRRSPSQQQQGVENDTPVVAATAAARSKDDGSGIGAQDVNVNGRGRSSKPYREDGLRLRLVLGGKS